MYYPKVCQILTPGAQGKSLTLIALMMHTLDVARSSGKGRKQGSVQVERGEAAPAPTLIIAPKSSTGPCSPSTLPCPAMC